VELQRDPSPAGTRGEAAGLGGGRSRGGGPVVRKKEGGQRRDKIGGVEE
jgi:hypothetical protein